MEGTLGKYEIRGTLGRGAAGIVYEGWDPVIARKVAIKTVRLPDSTDADAQEEITRFRREAQAAGRLTHPNIVGVFDYGETDTIAYIVMEYVEGETLKAVLDRKERFAVPDIIRLMDDLLGGLAYSHERGIIHRDIKPANLMMTRAGRIKIADFGIARIEQSGLTQLGTIMGTPAYMSPEQFTGQVVDPRTDLYSSGVVLYQLLTGERPFEGSMSVIMQKALNTAPPDPSAIAVTAPLAFDGVVRHAMAKRPEQRFASAPAFMEALHAAAAAPVMDDATVVQSAAAADATMVSSGGLTIGPLTPPPPSPPAAPPPAPIVVSSAAPRGGKGPLLFGGIGLALAAGIALFFFLPQSSVQRQAPVSPPPVTSVPYETKPAPVTTTPSTTAPTPSVTQEKPAPAPLPPVTSAPAASAPITPTPAVPPSSVQPQASAPAAVVPVTPIPATPEPPPPLPATPPSVATPPPIDRVVLASALAAVPCAMLDGSVGDDGRGVTLSGVIADGSPSSALVRVLADYAPGAKVTQELQHFPPASDYCRALEVLRPVLPRFGEVGTRVGLAMADGRTRLTTDMPIRVTAQMPDFTGELRIEYFSSDGNVYHVHPPDGGPAHGTYRAGEKILPGTQGAGGKIGEVGEPYGSDMIVAIASSSPLFAKPRAKAAEPSGSFLRDLQAALDTLRRKGGRASANVLILETAPR